MKKLFSIALCICLTFAAVFTAVPSFATKANADTEAAQALIGSYVNGGDYIKDTVIYTEATGAEYFHAGADSTTRRTVYSEKGTQLFMTTGENVYGAGYRDVTVKDEKKVERFYTDAEGEHHSYYVNKTSIKAWFTDLEEMATLGTWSLVDGKYESTLQAEHKQLWRDFVAPMWIGSAEVFTKVVMFKAAGLNLQLWSADTLFAQAIITLPLVGETTDIEATLTFDADKANRTSFSTTQQVWSQNGITFTNDKASSTTPVADYGNPVRLYKNSTIEITAPGQITTIVFNCNSNDYAADLSGAITNSSVDGSVVTITGINSVNATYTMSVGQVRLNSITVTYKSVVGHVHDEIEIRVEPTCTEEGSTETVCAICGATVVAKSVLEATGVHNYVDGVCKDCGMEEPSAEEAWTLVTNVLELKAGAQVVIVAKEYNYALSTTQNSNNRGQAAVTKAGNTITFGGDVQIITLGAGAASNTWSFNTGSGYLHAASSGSNYLRTEENLSANSSWTIEIAADGTATIVAQGEYTRNTMQYNQSSSLFACYASASQKALCMYIKTGDTEVCEHTNTSEETTKEASCEETGLITVTCDDCGVVVDTKEIEKLPHTEVTDAAVAATCTETGLTEGSHCSVCNEVLVAQETIPALGHTTESGTCERCGEEIGGSSEPVVETLATFEFGANGTATHSDGSSATEYTETVGDYTLTLSSLTNVYKNARDAKGNSCLKLGASSKAGGFSFTVPDNVTEVVIYVAKYKANTTKVKINDTTYTISGASTSGAYDEIRIDTTSTKTITLTTVSGGYRAMVNTIEFIGTAN